VPNVHTLVLKTAEGLAGELYEIVMKDDLVRSSWKAKHPGRSEKALIAAFVREWTPRLLSHARSTLAGMLALPYDQAMKDEIYEALLADNSLARPREVPILSRMK